MVTGMASGRFNYELHSITRNAPPQSGVYAIFSRAECIYVGESNDICASLLEHYFEADPGLDEKELTHFTFELASSEIRVERQDDYIRQLAPRCEPRGKSSRRGNSRAHQEKDQEVLMPALGLACH